jgi:hypothetical protein
MVVTAATRRTSITDRFDCVVEWVATDEDYRGKNKNQLRDTTYDEWGEVRSRIPGRLHKARISVDITSDVMFDYDDRDYTTVIIKPEISFTLATKWSSRTKATCNLTMRKSTSLDEALYDAGELILSSIKMPHRSETDIKVQRYSYRGRRERAMVENWKENRRASRRRRRQRRKGKSRSRKV